MSITVLSLCKRLQCQHRHDEIGIIKQDITVDSLHSAFPCIPFIFTTMTLWGIIGIWVKKLYLKVVHSIFLHSLCEVPRYVKHNILYLETSLVVTNVWVWFFFSVQLNFVSSLWSSVMEDQCTFTYCSWELWE